MRIRLKERCQIDGMIHEAGDIIDLPDGVKGPYRAVTKSVDHIDLGARGSDHANHIISDVEDVPLYEVLAAGEKGHSAAQKHEADAAGALRTAVEDRAPIEAEQPASAPTQAPSEVRQLTHIEERDQW